MPAKAECPICKQMTTVNSAGICKNCVGKLKDWYYNSSSDRATRCNICGGHRPPEHLAKVERIKGVLFYICTECTQNRVRIDSDTGAKLQKSRYDLFKEKGELLSSRKCKNCRKAMPQTQGTPGFCEDCAWRIKKCGNCNKMLVSDKLTDMDIPQVGHVNLCKTCIDGAVECDNCHTKYPSRFTSSDYRLIFRDKTGKRKCKSCCPDRTENIVNSYGYKPKPKFQPKETINTLFLGVELEAELMDGSRSNNESSVEEAVVAVFSQVPEMSDLIYCKTDSSIHHGIEFVTHPCTLKHHRTIAWEKLLNRMKEVKFRSHDTDSCGLHVHINKNYFCDTDKIKLVVFVNTQLNKIAKLARRHNDHYSNYIKAEKTEPLNTMLLKTNHYTAINCAPAYTIEFRMFKGTLNYHTFTATLEFVDALSRFIKESPITLIRKRTSAWCKFVEFVRQKKEYKELLQYMEERKLTELKPPKSDKDDTIYVSKSTEEEDALGLPKFRYNDRREAVMLPFTEKTGEGE